MSNTKNMWPKQGDRLFISEGDYRDTAVLNAERDNLSLYAVGFKKAGDMLVKRVMIDQRNFDSLVFPIAFNYRQYLELRLKQLIRDGNRLLGMQFPSEWPNKWPPLGYPSIHKVDGLWKECKPILQQAALGVLNEKPIIIQQTLEAIEKLVTEFAQVDPDSMAFRYSEDRTNNPSLPGLSHINLRHFKEEMNKIASFFEALAWPISLK